jgi:Beta/Gamma crystallin
MPKSLCVVAALLFVTAPLLIPGAMAGEAASSSAPAAQIVAFDNEDFLGDHVHIFGNMKDLGKWGNSISSMVILSGTWEFFDDEDFTGTSMGTLGPGTYADVTKHGLKNNSVSSVRLAKPAASATR